MKKILLTAFVALLCVTTVSAQDDQRDKGSETKKGYNILPAKGDFALGISANPFLNYGRSLLNGNQPAPLFQGFGGRIYGKYYTRDNQAFRFGVGLGIDGNQQRTKVPDDAAFREDNAAATEADAHLFDKMNRSTTNVDIFFGYEWRRGYGRLQGFFGVQAGINMLLNSTTFNWANKMTAEFPNPTTTAFPGAGTATNRTLKMNGANSFGFNVGGFVGIEYFFARKMSLGAELGVGFQYTNTGKTKTTTETVRNGELEKTTTVGNDGGNSQWGFDTNVGNNIAAQLNGNIFLMFHF